MRAHGLQTGIARGRRQAGLSTLETALVAGLIAVVAIPAITAIGARANQLFAEVGTTLSETRTVPLDGQQGPEDPVAEIGLTQGSVTVDPGDGGGPVSAEKGLGLSEGYEVATGADGSVRLDFAEATIFTLGAGARLIIEAVTLPDGDSDGEAVLSIFVPEGGFGFVSGAIGEALEVETPEMIIGIRGTKFVGRAAGPNNVPPAWAFLLADPDGSVGEVELVSKIGIGPPVNASVELDEANQFTSIIPATGGFAPLETISLGSIEELTGAELDLLP